MADLQQHLHEAAAEIVPAPGDNPRQRQMFLDTGRALLLCGALAIVSTVANPTANATHAFIGFLAWILGVCVFLLALLPAPPGRVAPAIVVGVAALVSSLFKHFVVPWNLA